MRIIRKIFIVAVCLFSYTISYSQQTKTTFHVWQHDDQSSTQHWGISSQQAYDWLNQNNKNLKPIVVAVIDGDLDIRHEDIKTNLWTNHKKNDRRYPGAEHGWNFLGTSSGALVTKVGLESFREYKRLRPKYEGKKREDFTKESERKEFDYFTAVKKDSKIQNYINFFPYIQLTYDAYRTTDSLLALSSPNHEQLSLKDVGEFKYPDSILQQYVDAAVRSSFKYADTTKWGIIFDLQKEEYKLAVQRLESLDNISNPRDSIGDNIANLKDRYYGNAQLVDTTSFHGTFVSGLIAASRNNGIGIDGVASNALIMGIRAVPDGDEFDKDIALAIRFAVDHGANIINMSFGKYYSTNSVWVTDAMAYALKKNVLVVQAAGNDNKNLDSIPSYPQAPLLKKKKQHAYLMIGASTITGKKASFSNFGKNKVDFFAPGEDLTSTITGGEYMTASGTSFSAPVVSGIAAVVWGAFPKLKAYQLAQILKDSAAQNTNSDLDGFAITPGVVNLLTALKLANEYVAH